MNPSEPTDPLSENPDDVQIPMNVGGEGRTGIKRCGSGWISSVLQCLGHTDPFRHFLLNLSGPHQINFKANKDDEYRQQMYLIAYEIELQLIQMWSGVFTCVDLEELEHQLEQHVGADFFDLAMDAIYHAHTLRPNEINRPDHDIYQSMEEYMNDDQERNESPIFDIFYHYYYTKYQCRNPGCGRIKELKESTDMGSSYAITVQLGFFEEPVQQLENMLEFSFKNVKSGKKIECECSSTPVDTSWTQYFAYCPPIFIFYLPRFNKKGIKIDDLIKYPLKGLDMRPYLSPNAAEEPNTVYDLFAVIFHNEGSRDSPHYECLAKPSHDSVEGLGWRHFNDHLVTDNIEERLVKDYPDAYVLFYRRNDDVVGPGPTVGTAAQSQPLGLDPNFDLNQAVGDFYSGLDSQMKNLLDESMDFQ